MIIDPSVQILTTPGELPLIPTVGSGKTTIPRYRQDKGSFYYKYNGSDYRLQNLLEYISEPVTIINASSIPFATPGFSVNLQQELRSINAVVSCTTAQHGYTPGQFVSVTRGVSFEINPTSISATIFRNGVRIIQKSGTFSEAACNVSRWQLFFIATFYLPQ